ncbi:T9SS type B sorting domain-containing protein [Moheibacter stercoris]|uniref:Gliding motility-associated-like protein n=1 Tax=Moheibacter stercoris TaxID=1628251 RepID=A0ABV2LWN0_9FLAO
MKKILSLFISISFTINLFAQDLQLYEAFLGKYDFTMFGNTMNTTANGTGAPCTINTSSSANLTLTPNQTLEKAYLYWAGSGGAHNFDFNIRLNNIPITPTRTFTTDIASRDVTSAFADITNIIAANGNGVYTVSDFDLSAVIWDYCGNATNFGGWAVVVVYSEPTLTNNLVNVYDGFVRVDQYNNEAEITLQNLNVLNQQGNRVGFLAWEGDENIAVNERLEINNIIVSNPPLNPANNAFNGTNSFTGSNTLYNMDLDVYDISNNTQEGDDQLFIKLTSGQDAIIINNLVVVLNSEVPDATIECDVAQGGCDDRDIVIDYTVGNYVATRDLAGGTPIAFYADNELIGTSATQNIIPIGGSESGTITLTVPMSVANTFEFRAKVDDDGTGQGTVTEFSETNNEYIREITLGMTPLVNPFDALVKCDTNDDGFEIFDLTITGNQMVGTQTGIQIRFYINQADAEAGNGNNIVNPNAYTNIYSPQTIYVRMNDIVGCYVVTPFQIEITSPVELTTGLPNLLACSLDMNPVGDSFDLTQHEALILNGSNPADFTFTYHLTQSDARTGNAPIANPTAYINTASPQTIWVRKISAEGCVEFVTFQIETTLPTELTHEIDSLSECAPTMTLTGITIDLTENLASVLNGGNAADYIITYHLNQPDAANGVGAIVNSNAYQNTSATQTIWVRLVDDQNCVQFGSFEIMIVAPDAIDYTIPDFENCSEDQVLTGIATDLTLHEPAILNGADPTSVVITYHTSQTGARNNTDIIAIPTNYINISSPETIWVRLEDENGCISVGSFELIYRAAPLLQTAQIEECSMFGPAEFNLANFNPLISDGSTDLVFEYYATLADAQNQTNALPVNYTPTTISATVFIRVANQYTCWSIIEVQLETVINTSELDNTYFECDSPTEPNDGFTSFNLPSLQNQINTSLGLAGSILTFHTSMNDAETGANPIPNPSNYVNTSSPQTIYARALDADGNCGGIAEFIIEVAPVPEFELPEYVAYCPGDERIFNFFDPYGGYLWLNPDGEIISNSSTVTFEEEGMHTLIVRETADGCPAERQIEVIFDNPPTITNIVVNDHTVTISATGGTPPYQYSYNNGLTWHDTYILNNVPGGIHDLIAKSKYGCISDAKTFGVLGIPNFISPNGDGINDYWEIRGLEVHPDAHIQIFDRYGKLFVDRKIDANFRWDAKYLGNPIPSGDYWYIITISDGKKVSGHISVRNR